jgi:ABC-type polysaccharide/polyol phosphate export permease
MVYFINWCAFSGFGYHIEVITVLLFETSGIFYPVTLLYISEYRIAVDYKCP